MAAFIGDESKDGIIEWYERILSSRHERILAEIGGLAYIEVMSSAVEAGMVKPPGKVAPSEIRHVTELMLTRQHLNSAWIERQKSSETTISFRRIGRALGAREGSLLYRRCVEMPTLFDVLRSHRNKRAHPGDGEVTEATLYALAGTVLSVLELSSDKRLDAERREKVRTLREDSESAVAAVVSQTGDASLRGEIEHLQEELASLQDRKNEADRELAALKATNDVEGTVDVSRQIQNAMINIKAHVTKRTNEIKDECQEMGRQFDNIRDAVEALRDDPPDYDDEGGVLADDESSEAKRRLVTRTAPHGRDPSPELTGEVARQMLKRARRRLEEKGWGIRVNVFQPLIVDRALEKAATEGLAKIEDWWNLPIVRSKSAEEQQLMQRQLDIPECKNWMMGIYSRVERRGT